MFQNHTFHKVIHRTLWILSIFLVLFFVWKRVQWDRGVSPLIQTDAQIKLYQTAQYAQKGIKNHNCLYGAEAIDPEFKHFPFHYPWVIYTDSKRSADTCRFQYPAFFAQGFSGLYLLTGTRFLNGAILLFYFLVAFLVYKIATLRLEIQNQSIGLVVFILALTGYPQNSGFEYSETVISNLCFLLFLNSTLAILLQGQSTKIGVLYGLIGSLALFLRSETVFYYFSLGLGSILFFKNSLKDLFWKFRYLLFGFLAGIIFFASLNYIEFGTALGIRSKITYSDFLKLNLLTKIELLKGYFLGTPIQVGLFSYCAPMIFGIVGFFILKRNKTDVYRLLFFVSVLGLLLVQTFSPYNPGGLYAGLRFTEISYYCFVLLLAIVFQSIQIREKVIANSIVYLLCVLQIFFGLYHTRKNIQVVDFVKKHLEILQGEWNRYPTYPVVHKSLFDMFLISTSYLEKNHFVANNEKSWEHLESILVKNRVPGIQVFYFGLTPPKDINAPQDFYEEWIDTKYSLESKSYLLEEKKVVEGFVLERYSLKTGSNSP
ncbi:hypothetical protein JWG45_07040 [Leptospira sp. 201903070]|uniref:Glycosyltransferase RgtA/B/C/D-like domain-containing protein n=1 Tax=Leptospira ainlahdjerensis TaxID=2810033 RepID=A0ABS2UBH4_9LEPT|nr:hypothetical protein [Leptospira ainlahdjerensis]MBM9576908.1 hypothetical protein [Leptospira ainlahdjerensis]